MDVSTVVTIIKTTKNRKKNKLGCLPTSSFFYAFQLGTMIAKDAHKRIRVEAKESINKKI